MICDKWEKTCVANRSLSNHHAMHANRVAEDNSRVEQFITSIDLELTECFRSAVNAHLLA